MLGKKHRAFLHRTHSSGDDAGAVLVMTALFLVVLLGFSALVIDVGLLYINRLALVNAVDAAALAGVQDLPYSPTMAIENAKRYAATNGADRDGVSVLVRDNDHEVQVTAFRDVHLYLARIFGRTEQRITASATARVGSIRAYRGVVPFGIEAQDFIWGEQYILKLDPHVEPGPFRGNFQALALGGQGASDYEENLIYGYQGVLEVGDWIDTEPGNIRGKTIKAVRTRINQCPHYPKCTWEHVEKGCSRVVITPVIKSFQDAKGRSEKVEVVGFAAFFLEGTLQGSDSAVVGRFLPIVVTGELGDAGDFGLRGYKLVK
ncbi:MAG: hypothetical protein GX998_10490 [Firmicutes bacterium]|nr:hypothetical protein [Bacillota bacterium]